MKILSSIALSMSLASGASQAATFEWDYVFDSGAVLSGVTQGTLGADMDTITIEAIEDVSLNGMFFADSLLFESASGFVGIPGVPAAMSLSGTVMDVCADTLGDCALGVGFFFIADASAGTNIPDRAFLIEDIPFDATAWTISQRAAAVPLPASGVLLIAGLAGLGAVRRRKIV